MVLINSETSGAAAALQGVQDPIGPVCGASYRACVSPVCVFVYLWSVYVKEEKKLKFSVNMVIFKVFLKAWFH